MQIKGKRENKMQSFNRQHIICSIAKQVVMPSYWLAIHNGSLSFDRTPERLGFLEDSVS